MIFLVNEEKRKRKQTLMAIAVRSLSCHDYGLSMKQSLRLSHLSLLLLLLTSVFLTSRSDCASARGGDGGGGGGVITVNYKFAGKERSLSALKAHDTLRHLRILAAGVDLPLGGTGRPNSVGAGNAPKEATMAYAFALSLDLSLLASAKLHPNQCFLVSQLELTLYDPKESLTGKLVSCEQEFCLEVNDGFVSGCKANVSCLYTEVYGDGSYSIGYFVNDVVQYDRVSGDLQTKLANGSVIFGSSRGHNGGSPAPPLAPFFGGRHGVCVS
ncbi:hypothetical protein RJ639_026435 [Escallonia herrerae]|uniref:Xylanase inhibitor N-terminal domain-containing protein n=1 Tax=Escallonia herrerae TaxID=1293975 RepID=A0AA88RU75_9ASTE|nr:hypothetical protein RJ639_026435 [Escallonia herrerae]